VGLNENCIRDNKRPTSTNNHLLSRFVQKIWCPPTPPQDDSDVYMDYTLGHLYETRIMDEASLPPVYVRKELKRPRKESVQAPPDDGELQFHNIIIVVSLSTKNGVLLMKRRSATSQGS
jgi:hypothetical protein